MLFDTAQLTIGLRQPRQRGEIVRHRAIQRGCNLLELFVQLMRLAYQRKIKELKAWSEQVSGMGRERQRNFLTYCQRMLRESFVYNFKQYELNYMTREETQFVSRFAPFITPGNVTGIMHELSEAQTDIEQNVNARMVFFDLVLKIIMLLKQKQ